MERKSTFIFFMNKPLGFEKFIKQQPYMPIDQIYLGVFREKLENWLVYNSGFQQFPTPEILENAGTIIISGSQSSAYEDTEWVVNFKKWIKNTYENYSHLKFLGVCFGEQIIAMSLGGNVEKTELRKKDPSYYRIGIDICAFTYEFLQL